MVGDDRDRRVARVLDEPADVAVEIAVEAQERILGMRVSLEETACRRVPEPVGRGEEDEEVIPRLPEQELPSEGETGLLDRAEILEMLLESGLERRRVVDVGRKSIAVRLTPVDWEDASLIVAREPAVDDHGALVPVLIEREVDEDRSSALPSERLVVRRAAKVAIRRDGQDVALPEHEEVVDSVGGR